MTNITAGAALVQADTLTKSYSEKWEGVSESANQGGFVEFMSSNELIFVVLGVSLIIWFVLIFFLIRLDKKVSQLEQELDQQNGTSRV